MFIARTRTEGLVIARWWRRLWLWVARRRDLQLPPVQDEAILELSEWDVDVWEEVPHVVVRLSPRPPPPPIPTDARPRPAPAVIPAAAAPSPDLGGWDDVLARARARLISGGDAVDPLHVATTPAPAFDPNAHRTRLPRATARTRGAERRARPPTGSADMRWADLLAAAQSSKPAKPAAAQRRRRRHPSSLSLACPPGDEAIPSTVDPDESSSGVTSGR